MKRYHKKRIFWNLVIYIIIGLTFIESRAQVLPNERGVDWSIAGLRDTTTLGFNLYNASNEGFSNSGLTPNDIILSNFLSNHTEPLILFFPAGNYLFNESITMRSNLVIRGEGADVTIFSFNQGGSGHSIKFIGSSFGTPVNLANSAIKDENTIDVVDVLGFTSGDWIHLSQDDTDLVTSSWGIGTVGQIMKIHSIQNNVLQMESEFRMNYDLNRNPNIRTFNPIKNAGIECIRFDRSDNTAPEQASIFFFNRAVNCWVKGVESVMTTFSHFEGRYCSNLSVSNSYFHDAFEYGGYSFAKEALSLIDNLDRSKHVLESDDKLKDTEALKKTLEHLNIIKKDLISIFEKNNIKPIDSLNKKLDPNFHQAMIEIEDDTKEPGTIIQEIQKGFTIKDRLLRPSLVGVSKKVTKKEEKTEENQENKENK